MNSSLCKNKSKAVLLLSGHIAIKALTYSSTHSLRLTVRCDLHIQTPLPFTEEPTEPVRKLWIREKFLSSPRSIGPILRLSIPITHLIYIVDYCRFYSNASLYKQSVFEFSLIPNIQIIAFFFNLEASFAYKTSISCKPAIVPGPSLWLVLVSESSGMRRISRHSCAVCAEAAASRHFS